MSTYVSNRNGSGATDEQGHYRFQTKVWQGNILSGLKAVQNSPLARNVLIGAGDLKIDYGEYAYTAWNDANVTVSLATADTTNPRLDRVVAYIDRSLTSGGTNNPGYLKFMAIAGTPGASPTKASDATVQAAVTAAAGAVASPWVELAVVRVNANATTIPDSVITDTRTWVSMQTAALAAAATIAEPGQLVNGQIVRSVTTNNLTVAIKTLAGNDPSEADPVYVRIGNTIRRITAALSVTKNAGTNYFSKGQATWFGGVQTDYFVYMVWNTNEGAINIAFGSIPDGLTYADFSTTTTNWNYIAGSWSSAPSSTDVFQNAGRFNAILGVSGSYNWSVPTAVIANKPTFETRILSYTLATGMLGTYRLQQRGSLKEIWGWATGATGAVGAVGNQLPFPTNFFTAVDMGQATVGPNATTNDQWPNIGGAAFDVTQIVVNIRASSTTAAEGLQLLVRGR